MNGDHPLPTWSCRSDRCFFKCLFKLSGGGYQAEEDLQIQAVFFFVPPSDLEEASDDLFPSESLNIRLSHRFLHVSKHKVLHSLKNSTLLQLQPLVHG